MDYKNFIIKVNLWRILPGYYICLHSKFNGKVRKDLAVWKYKHTNLRNQSDINAFGWLLMNTKEFRNLMLNRLHRNKLSYVIFNLFFKPLESLYINMPPEKIGGGVYFQHGFSTIIAANEIGENCSINQQVTIGYNGEYAPIIGDNVTIAAGAIVIGNVTIKNNATIAAGSVVTHDVMENATVAGVPANTIKVKNRL